MFNYWRATGRPESRYPVHYNFSLKRGDLLAWSLKLTFNGAAGLLNANGRVFLALRDNDKNIALKKELDFKSQDETGEVAITLLPSETRDLSPAVYEYEIEFYFAENVVFTAQFGEIEIYEDIITEEVRTEEGGGEDD